MVNVRDRGEYVYKLADVNELRNKYPSIKWDSNSFKKFQDYYYSKPGVTTSFLREFYRGYWQKHRREKSSVDIYKEFLVSKRVAEAVEIGLIG